MPKKIAIDWDEHELRLVAGQVSGSKVKITDAVVIPLDGLNAIETLHKAVKERGLAGTDALIAIGRGYAELRELQLPPVPEEELPDMVRFQAIRSFASAGDSATVDFLVTRRSETGVEMIAAAIGPTKLNEIRKACEACSINANRVSLRPLAAASLYLTQSKLPTQGNLVLVDLLAGDAEIVVARDGKVVFVRTVRMPTELKSRPRALAGELRRSLVACGADGTAERVILWGRQSVHVDDQAMLAEAAGSPVDVIDPFDLVDVDAKVRSELPDHVGRLAPLVGLLAADESHPERLIDFLNPRKRVEEEPNHIKTAVMVAVPALLALVGGYLLYGQLSEMDTRIAELKSANAEMKPAVDAAATSISRTETVDQFLDGDVNWLAEMRRLAKAMPPADKMIVRGITGTTDPRAGGGKLVITAAVTQPAVIDEFERSLRDADHIVVGDGVNESKDKDAYRFGINETVTINPASIRNQRYEGILAALMAATESSSEAEPTSEAETTDEAEPANEADSGSPETTSGPSDPASAPEAETPEAAEAEAEAAEAAEAKPADADPPPEDSPEGDQPTSEQPTDEESAKVEVQA
ncbi:hypothetical protein K227x_16510 [Rubripirellula lacrimiformis]|uniref:Competence protein A n=1 Tax=Rubripirellula lacrimiformis TaxID=1930273 RepID=A0A517N803_9BACT|nr:hypothetical protein [Rubripirellula lacrimiformis]QDT03269.1 hypothetical protein K227x_16510 [Rubripirellula lacrimiformis]